MQRFSSHAVLCRYRLIDSGCEPHRQLDGQYGSLDEAIADGVQSSASGVTNRVVERGLAIPPTIRVGAGTRITVIVTRRHELQS